MLKCRLLMRKHFTYGLCTCSDGATPEEKTKQILAITPILPGQTTSQNQSSTKQSNGRTPQLPKEPYHPPSQSPKHHDTSDLIDFGQSSAPALQQQQSSIQPQMQSQHMPQGLQEPLQPEIGTPIKRQDTLTKEVDEFVDAEP